MPIPFSGQHRAEHRILLLCARGQQTKEQRQAWVSLLEDTVDWEYLVPRLDRNGLTPLFLHHVEVNNSSVPDSAFQALRAKYIQRSLFSLALLTELSQVVELLKSHHINVLAYKGPALAQLAYGTLKLRHFSDLDLLIHPRDRQPAIALLEANGYEREMTSLLPPPLQQKRDAADYEITLIPQQGLGTLDLHWRVNAPHERLPIDFTGLWERRLAVEIAPGIESPCREDLILCLCAHGIKHRWHRIEWIASLLSLLQGTTEQPLDWDLLSRATKALGNHRILYLGLRLALDLALVEMSDEHRADVQAFVPADLQRAMDADPVVDKLSRQVWQLCLQSTATEEPSVSFALLLFSIRLREGWGARLAYLRSVIKSRLLPNPEDAILLDSRGRFTPMVYVRRLSRIFGRRVQRFLKPMIKSDP